MPSKNLSDGETKENVGGRTEYQTLRDNMESSGDQNGKQEESERTAVEKLANCEKSVSEENGRDVSEPQDWLSVSCINFKSSSACPEEPESLEVRSSRRTQSIQNIIGRLRATSEFLKSKLDVKTAKATSGGKDHGKRQIQEERRENSKKPEKLSSQEKPTVQTHQAFKGGQDTLRTRYPSLDWMRRKQHGTRRNSKKPGNSSGQPKTLQRGRNSRGKMKKKGNMRTNTSARSPHARGLKKGDFEKSAKAFSGTNLQQIKGYDCQVY